MFSVLERRCFAATQTDSSRMVRPGRGLVSRESRECELRTLYEVVAARRGSRQEVVNRKTREGDRVGRGMLDVPLNLLVEMDLSIVSSVLAGEGSYDGLAQHC